MEFDYSDDQNFAAVSPPAIPPVTMLDSSHQESMFLVSAMEAEGVEVVEQSTSNIQESNISENGEADDDDDDDDDDEEEEETVVETRLPPGLTTAPYSFMSGGQSWEQVKVNTHAFDALSSPGPRSLHVAVLYQNGLYIFAGYDGSGRVNDFHLFDFVTSTWHCLNNCDGTAPRPRDRHAGVVVGDYFLVFGGYDGLCRINDLHIYSFAENRWDYVERSVNDCCPSARHSHSAVGSIDSMFVFGGYDGAYKNDLYKFTLDKSSRNGWGTWSKVLAQGRYPQARYRATLVSYQEKVMILFGGHDGSRHLNDTHIFTFETNTWSSLRVQGSVPLPRDSHAALIFQDCMFVFGGSSGNAMNDFHYLNLNLRGDCFWSPVQSDGWYPCSRFCHVAVEYDNSVYIYGGYDGSKRLKDFIRFKFAPSICRVERSMLVDDLYQHVGNDFLSDVVFVLSGNVQVPGHKVFCTRCSGLLSSDGSEEKEFDTRGRLVVRIDDVPPEIFKVFLAYLYTDKIHKVQYQLPLSDVALDLYPLASRYQVERLKRICLNSVSAALNLENAAVIFQAADMHSIDELRDRSLHFILLHFDRVSKTEAFEEMGRTNVELVFDILRNRGENEKVLTTEVCPEVASKKELQEEEPEKGREWTQVKLLQVDMQCSPSKRSLHVAAVYEDGLYIFGGYNGERRVNDFYKFDITNKVWSVVPYDHGELPPSPRDRHTAVVLGDRFWVFGGYDGRTRVKELHFYDFMKKEWGSLNHLVNAPSARHSHSAAAVTYNGRSSMYVFAGYDGSYKNDLYEFNAHELAWQRVKYAGRPPCPRYRTSLVSYQQNLFLFAGHDGFRHLNDVYMFNVETEYWCLLQTIGPPPTPRDSHVAQVCGNYMYVFGGSSGNAMDDFYKLRLRTDSAQWAKVQTEGMVPSPRFCHASAVFNRTFFVYGGYDGSQRLNDFIEFSFTEKNKYLSPVPRSSLIGFLHSLVGMKDTSDVTFIVEGKPVYAHKILCVRCPYFRAMLSGGMRESSQNEIEVLDIKYDVFLALLQYLYTDRQEISLGIAMDLFVCADRFGVERLKNMCENRMLSSIDEENVSEYFAVSEYNNAEGLHQKCLSYIVLHFDTVSKTQSFEDMGRDNIDLVFKVLKSR